MTDTLEKLGAFYFTADWCKPCQSFKPVAYGILQEKGVPVQLVNIDEDRELALMFGILSVPTVVLTRGAEEIVRTVGAWPAAKFREVVDKIG